MSNPSAFNSSAKHLPSRQATIGLNLAALEHNLKAVKQRVKNSKILAMVKADAYGHGVNLCLPALTRADALGVAFIDEALTLINLGWQKPIVIIEGVFNQQEWQQAVNHDFSCVVHQQAQVDWALAWAKKHFLSKKVSQYPCHVMGSDTIWLKLNTGMNRLGFCAEEIIAIAQPLHDAGFKLILTSHFANADDKHHPLNLSQIATFERVLKQLQKNVSPNIKASLCNSAGIINYPDCHYDWVRPGIMLYGSSPVSHLSAFDLNLRPVMRFCGQLMAIHSLKAGDYVGYGSQFKAQKDMVKGIVSVGYGDGYPRTLQNTAKPSHNFSSAWVSLSSEHNEHACPIIGRVAMDMIAIDISHVPNAMIGDTVTLWGDANLGQPHVDEIAAFADTIGYELLCRLTKRPKRLLL